MEESRESTVKENDVVENASSSRYVDDRNDVGVYSLETGLSAFKRSRYFLCRETETRSMGYGWNTHMYKRKQKRCLMNDDFVKLPEEIVLKIFKMMDKPTLLKCMRVCHQWQRIASDKSLWQYLNIKSRCMKLWTLDNLLARNIKYFSASHSNIYNFEKHLCTTPFPNLHYLDLSSVFMHNKTLRSLLRQCSNLIKLSLENCSIDFLCCQYIGLNTNLKVLNLASTMGLDRNGLEYIVSLQNLEELNVSWAYMEDDSFQYLMANMIPNIKCLNISGFLNQFEDFDLSRMSSRCTKLIELDISDSLTITASSLDKILEKNHELEVLSMNRCYNIVTPRLLNPTELYRRKRISIMSLKKINFIGISSDRLFGDEPNILANISNLDLTINDSVFSGIGRPKLADNKHTIWEIPAFIDS